MVYKVIWTETAVESFGENIEYVDKTWGDKEAKTLVALIEQKLSVISAQPDIGKQASFKGENVRLTVLHKRLCLIYRVMSKRKTIELLLFWNTYQNPAKLK